MGILLLVARLLLVIVFLVSGLAKLFDLTGSQKAMKDFGLPKVLAAPLGLLLPFVELAVAVALLPAVSAWWGAIGALALLLIFIGGISYNLAQGRKPDCHCFGQLQSEPIGWPTVVRNVILAVVAGLVVWQGRLNAGPNMLAWLATLTVAQDIELGIGIVLLVLVALEGWVLLEAMRQIGKLLVRVEELEARPVSAAHEDHAEFGLPEGTAAPAFELPDLSGELVSYESLLAIDKPLFFVFSDPHCGPCSALMPDYGKWEREHSDKLTFALISRGTVEENRAKTAEYGIQRVLLQTDREVANLYQARGTPSALIVRRDGSISSPLAEGEDEIRDLLQEATVPTSPRTLPVLNGKASAVNQTAFADLGAPAADVTLQDPSGHMISLSDFRGSPTVLLFYDPGCTYCEGMLRELKAWEAKPPKDAPQLLVVSRGSLTENRMLGLRSTIVRDPDFNTATFFQVTGTPSAILIDEEGIVASKVKVGGPDVMKLIKTTRAKARAATR
jgi:peroxiredoxin